jgi:hypothetical protein
LGLEKFIPMPRVILSSEAFITLNGAQDVVQMPDELTIPFHCPGRMYAGIKLDNGKLTGFLPGAGTL